MTRTISQASSRFAAGAVGRVMVEACQSHLRRRNDRDYAHLKTLGHQRHLAGRDIPMWQISQEHPMLPQVASRQ